MKIYNPRFVSVALCAYVASLAASNSAWAQSEMDDPAPADPEPTAADEPTVPEPEPVEAAPADEAAPAVVQEAPLPELPATPEPGPEVTPPKSLAVGKKGTGTFEPGALLQFWTTYSHQEDTPDTLGFRLRRAELKVKGQIVPERVAYNLMIDAAKVPRFSSVTLTDSSGDTVTAAQPSGSDQSMLQDFSITFITDYTDISLGQFKNPVSMEGLTSSARLLFPERADVAREYGDRRDLGIKFEKKLGDYFYYYAGVFSGSGLNTPDVDNDKDLGLRLEVYPIEGLTVGAVGYATVGDREEQTRDRIEGDVRFDAHGFFAQAEYIRAWNVAGTDAPTLEGHGAFLGLGYTLDQLQPTARIGFLDRNVDADDDAFNKYEFGLNYFIQSHEARLALSASFTDPQNADVPLRTDVILAAQVSF